MNYFFRFSLLLTYIVFNLYFPVLGQSSSEGRKRILFNDNWKFHLGNASDPSKDFDFGIANILAKSGKTEKTPLGNNFDDAAWRTLNLPHDWAIEVPFIYKNNIDLKDHGYRAVGGLFPEYSIGWYRKQFSVAAADSGKRFSITFDGIFRNAKFWLNGFYLGTNESGYIGKTYDITDFIDFKKKNTLVVRVDATQYEGWFYEGAGIYRNVWLNITNPVHLDNEGVFIHTRQEGTSAAVTVEAEVKNDEEQAAEGRFITYVKDRNGKIVAGPVEQPFHTGARASQKLTQQIKLDRPVLWSPENPYLYRLISEIRGSDEKRDHQETRFGVRTIEIRPNGVYLNGHHIKIKGTNNHQDHAGLGSALPDYLQYYRISLLKQMGSNAYRTSHHAPTPELLDACDSLGMLVLDEQRLLNSGPEYTDQFERLIKRDRNHPSVFLWSIGNEEGFIQTNGFGQRIARTLLAKQRELDPTRTSTYAADLANVWGGVNEVIPVRGFNYRQFAVEAYHKAHPEQPIIGTEMGSTVTTRGIYEKDTVKAYLPDQDLTAPWWASLAEQWWPLASHHDYWLGGFIWTGFDYRGEPTPYAWPNISSHFGVMDICGFPKNLYYYYKSWWSDEDVLHISPHWNVHVKDGQNVKVWVNSNAEKVELFLNGKSLGTKTMKRDSHLEWDVPYRKGTLSAVGYRNGRKLTEKVETTGAPYRVKLLPSKTTVTADGRDAVVINVSVVDKKGREVPDADNLIRLSLSGVDGRLIGCGNGDPSSHEPDKCQDGKWQRRLFNGKCQFIMLGGTQPGKVTITGIAEGLENGVTILSQAR